MCIKNLYCFIFTLILFFGLTRSLLAFTENDLKKVKIKSISYEGSGCPEGSVFFDISPDKEVFTLLFNSFIVSKEGPLELYKKSKNCKLSITLKKPKNLGFKFFTFSLEGASDLEENILAKQEIRINTQGKKEKKPKREISIKGPYSDSYERIEEFKLKDLRWSSCNKKQSKITLRTKMTVSPFPENKNEKSGFMSLDFAEGFVKQKVGLIWTDCKKPEKDKPFLSFCKIKIESKKSKKIVREVMVKSRDKAKEKSLKEAKEKVRKFCSDLKKKNLKRTCSLQKTLCETKEIN